MKTSAPNLVLSSHVISIAKSANAKGNHRKDNRLVMLNLDSKHSFLKILTH